MIYSSPEKPIDIPEIDICSFLFQPNIFNCARPRNRPLLIDGLSGKSLSFKEAKDLACRISIGWKESVGLTKGDVVAVFAPNQYDHAVLYFSLLIAQCVISPGNPNYTASEFNHQIRKSQAKAIVTVRPLLPMITKVASLNGIPSENIFLFGEESHGEFLTFRSIAAVENTVQFPIQTSTSPRDNVAFICFSSGTTGLSKGVMLTHHNFVSQITLVTSFEQTDPHRLDDRIIGFLPFFHIFGLTSLVLRAFYSNTPVVVMPKYDLELFCQLVEKYKITMAPIVPPVAVHLAKKDVVLKYDLSSLRFISSGAAPLGCEHIDALRSRIEAPVRQGYGLTETTAGCIYQKIRASPPGSSGVLMSNMQCRLVDETGKDVRAGETGEIILKGPVIMKGYLNDDEANDQTFTEDGWLKTGDIAKYDLPSGQFYIIDRIKELIKCKGFQVAPAELEALLMSHKAVADCCVVGVYDASQATEFPRAYVVLQPSIIRTQLTISSISNFINDNVVDYKKLRGGIRVVQKIPKSASGKILRRIVGEWVKLEQQETLNKASL